MSKVKVLVPSEGLEEGICSRHLSYLLGFAGNI